MSLRYYQNNAPGWGTNQFQFGAPPTPNFQPQPSWGGMDYYRAHANASPDPSLFNYAWSRTRDYNVAGGNGASRSEAKHWHRRAYGGLSELGQMLPEEVGFAAAYEAYRTWIHNSSIYEPLSGEPERQREGLVGMAVAEAARLLQYAGRGRDSYARMAACESAAATASNLFYSSRDNEDPYHSRSRSRNVSFSGSQYGGNDPYAYDNDMYSRSRPRHRSSSRHRSASRSRVPMYAGSSGGMPIPGVHNSFAGSSYGMGHTRSSSGSFGSQYGGNPYGGGGVPMQISNSPYAGHAGSYGSPAMPISLPGIPTSSSSRRHRSNSMSMPYGSMPVQYAQAPQQYMPPQPQTIILTQPSSHKSRKHKHSYSGSKSHRSRSSDPGYRIAYPMQYAVSSRY